MRIRKSAGIFGAYREEKRELKVLAQDFELYDRKDVKEIIATCGSYYEGHRKLMEIYNLVYM